MPGCTIKSHKERYSRVGIAKNGWSRLFFYVGWSRHTSEGSCKQEPRGACCVMNCLGRANHKCVGSDLGG